MLQAYKKVFSWDKTESYKEIWWEQHYAVGDAEILVQTNGKMEILRKKWKETLVEKPFVY